MRTFAILTALMVLSAAPAAEPWSTYRGNPQRTGNTDGKPGPAAPKVLWAFKSQDHFVASPVPFGDRLFVSGLGAFNVSSFLCLPLDAAGTPTPKWSKSTPALKLPVVSSPAATDGKLVFGDGMHQTDGAVLHCVRLDTGLPLWQLPQPGALVHLEGAPTVANRRVYIGGGAAGVLCVDLDRVTLDGKDLDLAGVQQVLDARWKELQAKYEADKKKDPDFAVPPNEDQLPKPAPKLLWQQGQEKWHVDAPVTVEGDNVLVASAYLNKEKLGDRALFCLDANTGSIRWRRGLNLNPWGGAAVSPEGVSPFGSKLARTVVVAGSSINYDVTALKAARGEITALDLADGSVRWQREIPGGTVATVAIAPTGTVVACCTDGKVRAFNLQNGERVWVYDAGFPLFAPPAVAGNVVYAGDLRGTVHAIDLAAGKPVWKLDLGADPAVGAPGMVYGGPVVSGGRIYVATCNLEGPNRGKPTAVVCIGNK
jgi:outer membrane protein assembly factor BamB